MSLNIDYVQQVSQAGKYVDDNSPVTVSTRESTASSPVNRASGILKDTFYESECSFTDQKKKLLHMKSQEGQEFRLSLLNGRTLLVCCVGNDMSKLELYRHVKTRGVRMVVLDNPMSDFAQKLYNEGIIDEYLSCDLSPRLSVLQDITKVVDEYFDVPGRVLTGIMTIWDDAVCLHARLCDVYGVPGNSISSIDVVHDKAASRKFFCDMPSPKLRIAVTLEDAMTYAEELNFPVILKPLYGAASIGVVKVDRKEDIKESFLKAQRTVACEYETGNLMGLLFNDAENVGNSASSLSTFCIEEFLEGEEFDCDVVVSDGEIKYCNLIDDWPIVLPHFCELGSSCPSQRPDKMQEEVKDFAASVVRALKLTSGVFHIEVIYDNNLGPVLVEVNPRLGGGPVRSIHKKVYGVDLMDEVLLTSSGIPAAPPQIHTDVTAITVDLYAQKSGTLQKDVKDMLSFLEADENVESIVENGIKAGSNVSGWDQENLPEHLGYINFEIKDTHRRGLTTAGCREKTIEYRNAFYEILSDNTL